MLSDHPNARRSHSQLKTLKNIIDWNYERASWQWDVLCLLCLIFIFLTPKGWSDQPKTTATRTPPAAVETRDPR